MTAAQKQTYVSNLISDAFRNVKLNSSKDDDSKSIYARGANVGDSSYEGSSTAFQRRAEFTQDGTE